MMMMLIHILLSSSLLSLFVPHVLAFVPPNPTKILPPKIQLLQPRTTVTPHSTSRITTRLQAGGDDFSELTSALARLDQQWQIQQRSKTTKSRWSKVVLPPLDDDSKSSSTTTISNEENDYVWILEPPSNSIPSCAIIFTGGAGLGQFPHIAYNELLSRISNRLNAVCITVPYQVGLDHFSLAKQTGELLRRALIHCQDDPSRIYPSTLPTYSLAHSLGCKLQTIYIGATQLQQQFDGIGFLSFNNFSFGQTITMARNFADQLRRNNDSSSSDKNTSVGTGDTEEVLNTIFGFAETIVGAIGIDFTPTPKDTERLIQLRYNNILQSKTRLFVFDDDTLDNSREFVENCNSGDGQDRPTVCGLPGGHLTPVFFKWGIDDIDFDNSDIPSEMVDMAKDAMFGGPGGFQSASFGDEAQLNELVNEICNWIMGKPPKRGAQWEENDNQDSSRRNGPPQRLVGYAD